MPVIAAHMRALNADAAARGAPAIPFGLDLAHAAGSELLVHRGGDLVTESMGRRRELVTAADRAAERVIVSGLMASYPGHAMLAEEGVLTAAGQRSTDSDA